MTVAESCGIYLLRNAVNGKVYVGQSVNTRNRWNEHRKSANRGTKTHLYDAMRKYGLDSFEFMLVEECGPIQLDERETFWMDFYRAREDGYNQMPAGQGGRVMDEAARERISSKLRGRKLSADRIEQIRRSSTGRKHSEETKRKISEGNIGRTTSAESRVRISEAQKARHAAMTPEEKAEFAKSRSGWSQSDHAKEATSKRFAGKPKSAETREKMRQAILNESQETKDRRINAMKVAWAKRVIRLRAEAESKGLA